MAPSENQQMVLAVQTTSYRDLLESQKDLLQSQIGYLERVIATQCELTGTNPLSQEMAAGALSIKIGKRPRDLLNPKAVKYMQFVFSIKDAISKRETREISAQFGVTVTQVRDFFAGQRSRVRKLVRFSGEKADESPACEATPGAMASTSEQSIPAEPVPLNTMPPTENEEGPSCSARHEVVACMEEPDRNFIENVFRLMRKEESFSGQVKLLDWILRIENPPVLKWFLDEGGIMILATWLSEAASEEQTSVLRAMLKVLDHLPLKKAHPVQMSVVLHSVGRLRFYRKPDIASRSRILLHQWRKQYSNRIQALQGSQSAWDAQDEMLLKQSFDEVMGNELWDLKDDNSQDAQRLLCNDPENHRKLDTPPLKLLTASGDESNKRRGVMSSHTRERRKVQMVEHPSQRMAVRTSQVAKSTPTTQSRPLSADDIQKAKMRAQFMQSKHGKTITNSDDQVKPEIRNRSTSLQASVSPSVPKPYVHPELEGQRKVENGLSKVANAQGALNLEEPPSKKYKRTQIPWRTPPEIQIMDEWHVGTGANSKEVEVQKNRNKRERETFYRSTQEIPLNPREPWDREMDHDDTLTPVIPIEQLPDEPLETPVSENFTEQNGSALASASCSSMPEPDLELLAELLKNPELVFALTSGQGGNLPGDAMVKLLDMIKANGTSGFGNLAGMNGNAETKVEVSLPSPTPSSDPNGPKPDFSRNPFTRQHAMANGNAYQVPAAVVVQPQIQATTTFVPQIQAVQHLAVPPLVSSLQPSVQLPEQWHSPANGLNYHQHLNSTTNIQNMTPQNMINENVMVNSNRAQSTPHFPYSQEHTDLNSLRTRQNLESNYHNYQNNANLNNYNTYARGPMQGAMPSMDGRNYLAGRPGYDNWSPDNSPSRRHEYVSGQNYQEPHRYGSRPERTMPQNMGHPSGYGEGAGNKRWRDQRR